MTVAIAIEKRLEREIARALEIMGHVRDRPEGLNEADTKAAFIDPILSALGWELRDPFSVSQQYRHKPQDNPVDYALFILRAPAMFVEAKALNRDLSDYKWISQTLAYANAAGVEWCVLTNGDEYRIYNTFAKAEAEKKVFSRVRLSDRDERAFCIDTLLLLSKQQMAEKQIDVLWKAHFIDRQVREAVSAIFREPDAALVRMIVKRTQDLQLGEVRDSLRRADLSVRFPVTTMVGRSTQLGLQEAPASFKHEASSSARARTGLTKIRELLTAGVVQAPREIEVTFKGQRFTATIESGQPHSFRRADLFLTVPCGWDGSEQGQRATTRRAAVLVDQRLDVLALQGSGHGPPGADQQVARAPGVDLDSRSCSPVVVEEARAGLRPAGGRGI
jgi:predicted type IV restriction endonuclease